MDMFDSLHAFRRVVEEGSFAAAGRSMNLSRSQVSKLVVALEDKLGAQLLLRTTRSVSPTPAGEAFYQRAESILNDLSEAITCLQDDQDEPQGTLRINAPTSFGTLFLGKAIADFMRRHPKINVRMYLSDRFLDPVENGFDMTIRITTPFENLALIHHKITQVEHVFCAAPQYLSENFTLSNLSELSSHSCLHYADNWQVDSVKVIGPDGSHSLKMDGRFSANNGELIRDAAIAGLGVAYLPTFIVGEDIKQGRLVRVLENYGSNPHDLYLIYAPHRHLSARIRLFVEFMYDEFGNTPPW